MRRMPCVSDGSGLTVYCNREIVGDLINIYDYKLKKKKTVCK